MKFKEFLNKAFLYLSVPKCVCCKERLSSTESTLCSECMRIAEESMGIECPVCLKKVKECKCESTHLESHFLKGHIKLYRYAHSEVSKPLDSLIYSLKRGERDDVFELASDLLSKAVLAHGVPLENAYITNIPRRKTAIIRFGVDHARMLAKKVSEKLGIGYLEIFKSTAKTAQKSLRGVERVKNADFSLLNEFDLTKKTVIIVDDVVTTGASMGNAATLVRSMGAKNIYALSIGSAYNKKS